MNKITKMQKQEILTKKQEIYSGSVGRIDLTRINEEFFMNNFLKVYYVDSNGEQKECKMYVDSLMSTLDNILRCIESMKPTTSDAYVNTLIFKMMSECNNFGTFTAKRTKAFINNCSKNDSIQYDILYNIIIKGSLFKNNVFHNGNTIYKPSELINTIIAKTGLTLDYVQELVKNFFNDEFLSVYNSHIGYSDFVDIEKCIKEIAEEKTTFKFPTIDVSTFNDSQKKAIEVLTDNDAKINLLLGSAGTGKSYVLSKIITSCINHGVRVLVASPTHAAGKILAQSLAENGINLEDLVLKRIVTIDAAKFANPKKTKDVDIIICEESSMNSTYHFDLFRKIDCRKIVLCGDPKQLPPIESGSPFHDLVNLNLPKAYLTIQMRNKNEQITNIVNGIEKENKLNFTKIFPFSTTKKMPEEISESVFRNFKNYMISHKDDIFLAEQNQLVDWLNLVLLDIKRGNSSLDQNLQGLISAYFSKKEAPELNLYKCGGEEVFWDSDKFVIPSNENYCVVRGSKGIVREDGLVEIEGVKTTDAAGIHMKKFLMNFNNFPKNKLNCLKLMFAKTIHKSQGSSFDKVTYLVKDSGYFNNSKFQLNIQKDLAYVACSRAISAINVICFIHDISTYITPKTLRQTLLNTYV